jgi:hypothetical protein
MGVESELNVPNQTAQNFPTNLNTTSCQNVPSPEAEWLVQVSDFVTPASPPGLLSLISLQK